MAGTILLTLITLAILWFLDRREPESSWLYSIAVLWGALIATGLALPFNIYILNAVASFVKLHPDVQAIFGANARLRWLPLGETNWCDCDVSVLLTSLFSPLPNN
ncbi:hypothetical protein [Microcoleus asticus]|nr:hypothetical protein [Microcoleus asticus]